MEPEKKSGKTKVIIIVAVSAVAVAAAVTGIMLFLNSPARRLQRQLDLGARYLTDLQYDDAIAAYEAALAIDPKNTDAYIGIIAAQGGKDDADAVLATAARAEGALGGEEAVRVEEAATDAIIAIADGMIAAERPQDAAELLARAASQMPSEAITAKEEEAREAELSLHGINLLDWLGRNAEEVAAEYPQLQRGYYSNMMTGERRDIPPYFYVEENGSSFTVETYTPWETFWDESNQGDGTIIRMGTSWLYGGEIYEPYHADGIRSGMDILEIMDILTAKGWEIEPAWDEAAGDYDFSRRGTWTASWEEIGGVRFYKGRIAIWVTLDSFLMDDAGNMPAADYFFDPDSFWHDPHGVCTTITLELAGGNIEDIYF